MNKRPYSHSQCTQDCISDVETLLDRLYAVIEDVKTDRAIIDACREHNVRPGQFYHLMQNANKIINQTAMTSIEPEHILTPSEKLYYDIFGHKNIDKIPPHIDTNILPVMRKHLTAKELTYMYDYYFNHMNGQQVADKYKTTRQHINSIKTRSFEKLREPSAVNEIHFGIDYEDRLNEIRTKAYQNRWQELTSQATSEGVNIAEHNIIKHMKTQSDDNIIDCTTDDIPIEDMYMTARTTNALWHANIRTLYAITKYTEKELLRIRNLGATSLQEIKHRLGDYGLTIKKS